MTHNPNHPPSSTLSDDASEIFSFDEYDLWTGTSDSDRVDASDDRMGIVFARDGNDRIEGGGADDDLLAGAGNDRLTGAAGADHLDGGSGNDRLKGGDEADGLRGAGGNDRLDEGAGHGDLEGGPGNDVLIGGPGADAFVVDLESGHDRIEDFQAGPGMFDHLALMDIQPGDLRFEDGPDGVTVSWNGGTSSVLLIDVQMSDLAQDDFMFVDEKQVLPVGAAALDDNSADIEPEDSASAASVDVNALEDSPSSSSATPLSAHGGEDTPSSLQVDEFAIEIGSDESDTFGGTPDRDYVFGLGGDDQIAGLDGDDDLRGDAGDDVIAGGPGMDHIKGGDGNDEIDGGPDADNLMGEEGDDRITAGAGHDMIEGGAGNDTLDGGGGADAFIVAQDSGDDVVVGGFTAGPGAFDHIAFVDILPEQVEVSDTENGTLVSWGSGSILLEGVQKSDLAQDDFMFNATERGAFVQDPAISSEGSLLLFPTEASVATNPNSDFFFA